MAKDIPSKKYKGVYYRELKNGDRSYFIIMRLDGKQKRISVGKKSEGITEQFCYQQKVRIINADKFGEEQAEILQRTKKADPTFREIAEHYFKHGSAKDSTKRIMRYLLNTIPFADKKRVTEREMTEWFSEYGKTVSPGTINNKINLLNVLFKHGIDQQMYRHKNPMLNIKKHKVDDKRLRWLSKEEIQQLLDAVRDNEHLYLFTKFALCTGARLSSIVRVHKSEIKGDTVRLFNVKTGRYYTGFLDSETQQMLEQRTGYVFSMDSPERMPDLYQYQWRMLRVMNKLFNEGVTDSRDKVVVHTLRHTTASLLVQNGTPLHVVQKVLDHQSIRSTERYAKLHQDNIKSELHRLWQ